MGGGGNRKPGSQAGGGAQRLPGPARGTFPALPLSVGGSPASIPRGGRTWELGSARSGYAVGTSLSHSASLPSHSLHFPGSGPHCCSSWGRALQGTCHMRRDLMGRASERNFIRPQRIFWAPSQRGREGRYSTGEGAGMALGGLFPVPTSFPDVEPRSTHPHSAGT